MSLAKYDHGPLDTYEVIWNSGHIEHVKAHQVLAPRPPLFGLTSPGDNRWVVHGEIEGRWRLLLIAADEDIRSIRNVTHTRDAVQQGVPHDGSA